MGKIATICAVLWAALAAGPQASVPALTAAAPPTDTHSLYAQSAGRVLEREFKRDGISYLLVDARSSGVLAYSWQEVETSVPVGSLVKPFTALAYGRAHAYRYPQHVCTPGECWLPRGHGRQDLVSATANSCNAYFRALAQQVTAEQIAAVAHEFDLSEPMSTTPDTLIGLGREWPVSPIALAHAYAELVARRAQPGVADIVEGMRLSAIRGTGGEVGRQLSHSAALVKTGTAPCTHSRRASADGFVIALLPADDPSMVLLLRVHGATGARAAVTAGRMLQAIEAPFADADK